MSRKKKTTPKKKHKCGCSSPAEELDPRHIVHFDASKPAPKKDNEKAKEAFKKLEAARKIHIEGCAKKDKKLLEEARKAYKMAARAYAAAGSVTGAVLADSMDETIDYDIEKADWTD